MKLNKKNVELAKSVAVVVLAAAVILLTIALVISRKNMVRASEVEYHPAEAALYESNFYPGRIYGDYTDLVFSFDKYLNHIGATQVQRYMYESGEGTIQEMRFTFDGFDYKIKTTIFSTDNYAHGLYTQLSAEKDGVYYGVPSENCGNFIMDASSPFIMDRKIFDVFHIATDYESKYRKELQITTEESECPFRGFGIGHYERWKDGTVNWHDDLGSLTIADGLDLHY